MIDPFVPREIRRLVREFGSPLLIIDCERIRQQYRGLQRALTHALPIGQLPFKPHQGRMRSHGKYPRAQLTFETIHDGEH
ncbi:MAG: hypothetical protein ACO266_11345, partial [Steroidobacteraceae bacterium]